MYVCRLCPAESCTKLDQTFRGCCVGAGDFPPQEPTWGAFFGKAILGVQHAISWPIGMKIYIVTDNNFADVFGP